VYAAVFWKSFVIVNDFNITKDLFEKRGSKYSDRPTFVMAGELIGFDRVRHLIEILRFKIHPSL
jgi:hypothetical protein